MTEETYWWFHPQVETLLQKVQMVAPFKAEAIFDALAHAVFLICHEGRESADAVAIGISWAIWHGNVSHNSEVARFIDWKTKRIDNPQFKHDAVSALLDMLHADIVLVNVSKEVLDSINAKGHEFTDDDVVHLTRNALDKGERS